MKKRLTIVNTISLCWMSIFSMQLVANPVSYCNENISQDAMLATSREERRLASPLENQPTVVDISLFLTELSDISAIDSRFRFEAYGEFEWCDPREAFDPVEVGVEKKLIISNPKNDASHWTADLSITNGIGDINITESLREIFPDGRVRMTGYFNSTARSPFDLRQFPFDSQVFDINIESFRFNREAVILRWKEQKNSYHQDIFLPEWKIEGVAGRVEDTAGINNSVPYSRAIFSIKIKREYGYYIYKLSLPLFLIVALSWSVFWMGSESLVNRMRVSATAFLTIVAYQFAVSNSLPKVAYLTIMDRFMIASFIFIALTALQTMFVKHTFEANKNVASRMDDWSRWLFPSAYLLLIVSIANLYVD